MTFEIWIALAAANFLAMLAPGQNVALVGSATVQSGTRGGAFALAGILIAEMIWSVAALILALSAKQVSSTLFVYMQIASGVILIWFGWSLLREALGKSTQGAVSRLRSSTSIVLDGLWIGLANPLALMFFLTLFPTFVAQASDVNLTNPFVVTFFISAVLVSSAAGIAPYMLASRALSKAGLSKVLQMISASALLILGGLVLLRQAL